MSRFSYEDFLSVANNPYLTDKDLTIDRICLNLEVSVSTAQAWLSRYQREQEQKDAYPSGCEVYT